MSGDLTNEPVQPIFRGQDIEHLKVTNDPPGDPDPDNNDDPKVDGSRDVKPAGEAKPQKKPISQVPPQG